MGFDPCKSCYISEICVDKGSDYEKKCECKSCDNVKKCFTHKYIRGISNCSMYSDWITKMIKGGNPLDAYL